MTAFVSNGNGTPRVLGYLRPWVDLYKVDLKSFDDRHYRQLGGRLEPILATIRALHEMGIWLEIVTLLIPGFNDSPDEIDRLTSFVAGVSPDIPWHVTAFHKDYRMTRSGQHDAGDAGALPPRSGTGTACAMSTPGTRRDGSGISRTRAATSVAPAHRARRVPRAAVPADGAGACPECGTRIPGRWASAFEGQISARPFRPLGLRAR